MKAAFSMWGNTRMIILTAVCAAIYSAALLAFKTAIPLIPGITEIRVGNIFPMPFGLLFGPAGAWGSAIGNLIGDLFGGTFGPSSLAGFVGNFLLGFLPYALWTTLFPFNQKAITWNPKGWGNWITYVLVALVSSSACAVVISAFADLLGLVPYRVLVKIISLNNTVGSLIGVFLLTAVFGLIKDQLNLFWLDVMDREDQGKPLAGFPGSWLVTLGCLLGLFGGMVAPWSVSAVGWSASGLILIGCVLL
ncbi:MAG TPA: QueT transporter family protein [Thermodesulfobacteriota bacterium]|nr:QueT transporter family protein [Thermodesulfobacteriota bacterium]